MHARIAARLDKMLNAGLMEEVRRLWQRGDLSPDLPAMRSVGYRQFWAYFEGEISEEEAANTVLYASRQLAKRQLTWLRRWPADAWLLTGERGELLNVDPVSTPIWRQFADQQDARVDNVIGLPDDKRTVAALSDAIKRSHRQTI